jgi:E3 ubiquitin-protein ligase DRIP
LQVLSNGDTSSHPSGKDKGDDNKYLDKAELWRPLNCLVDPGSKTKLSRTGAYNPAVKGDKTNESPSSEHPSGIKAKELLQKSKAQDDNIDDPEPIVLLRKKTGRKRKHPLPSANAASTAASSQNEKAINPVWFSLIASFEQ